jgi:hypothetical protein
MPLRWVRAHQHLEDEIYFLVVAVSRAIKGRELLEHRGAAMPGFRQRDAVMAWRDIAEHWDEPGKGMDLRALNRWRLESNEIEPGLTFGGGDKLTHVSGVKVKWLRQDLRALRQAAGLVSEKEWDYFYIHPQQAAGILGVSVDDLQTMSNPPLSHDFGGEHGIRYWREWVEARTKGSLVPPGWADGVDPHSAVDSDEWSNADEDPDEIGD